MELDNPQHSKQFQNLLLPWSTRNICDGQWQGTQGEDTLVTGVELQDFFVGCT